MAQPALIFDMDGVIVDSNAAHRQAWEVYNRGFGLETTEAMHQRMYGKRNDEIVRDFSATCRPLKWPPAAPPRRCSTAR